MPTYEYACMSCGRHFEIYQGFSDPPLTTCDVCGGALRKVFHPAGILFKGSGFYATDSRSPKSGAVKPPGDGAKEPAASTTESPKKREGSKDAAKPSSGSTSKEKSA